jgi:nicotinate-nucleotide pyrophosphorylase (carboxylating)
MTTLPQLPLADVIQLVKLAVAEDLGPPKDDGKGDDCTGRLSIPPGLTGVGTLMQKAVGVACGLPLVEHMVKEFDPAITVEMIPGFHIELIEGRYSDQRTTPLLRMRGPMRSLLAAERTVLNLLQYVSGVATLTHKFVRRVEGTKARICDTRKTLPGYRSLAKYAVRVGGGLNHRIGLYDMVLVKDNHLAAMGGTWHQSLKELVWQSRKEKPDRRIEVEVADIERFNKVVTLDGIDIILLDNMDCPTMQRCVEKRSALSRDHIELEASGGVTLETVRNIALTGVERISVGALTHSAPALDISLEIEEQ